MTSEPAAPTRPAELRDLAARRQHPAYLLISVVQSVRALVPLAAVGFVVRSWWVLAVGAVLVAGYAVASWLTSTYAVQHGDLRVRVGVLTRKVTTIPTSRITALDAKRGVVQRVLGVWGLKVQTPGDGERASVRLHGLSHRQLEELLDVLRPADQAGGGVAPTRPWQMPGAVDRDGTSADTVVARLSTRSLLIAAVTGTSVPILLAGAGAAWSRLHDILPRRFERRLEDRVADLSVGFLVAAAAVLLVLAVLVGILLTSLRLANFTLSREGDRLRVNRGLLAQRSGTIAVDRVQAVRLVEGLWRRPLGYCAVEVEVAGIGQRDDNDRMLFPLVRRAEAAGLVDKALPELGWRDRPMTRLESRTRRRYLTLPILAALVPTAAALLLPGWWALVAVVWVPAAAALGWSQGHTAAWQLDAGTVVIRSRRVLARHTVVARTRRVQLTRTTQTPWQRRAAHAGVTLSLSSNRSARLRQVTAADAGHLLHVVGRRP